jgi:hypothetical protein
LQKSRKWRKRQRYGREETYSPDDDEIWQAVIEISEGKVGERLPPEQIMEVLEEGPGRYASKVPPGYEDTDKDGDRRFGDLIMWFETIETAKRTEKPVLLVTDDQKEDWWQRTGGKASEPHPELANEMHRKAGALFHMHVPIKFIRWAGSNLKQEISQKAAEEIERLSPLEESDEGRLGFLELFSKINSALLTTAAQKQQTEDESQLYVNSMKEIIKFLRSGPPNTD